MGRGSGVRERTRQGEVSPSFLEERKGYDEAQ